MICRNLRIKEHYFRWRILQLEKGKYSSEKVWSDYINFLKERKETPIKDELLQDCDWERSKIKWFPGGVLNSGLPSVFIGLFILLVIVFVIALSGYSHPQENEDVLFQTSTINALLEGVYDGEITYGELEQYGDFGIGTFNGLDGEMIGLEGTFYQIKADGIAYPVDASMRTPFAAVTFFEADKIVLSDRALDQKELEQYLDDLLPTKNIFYALKIEGVFKYIKARSVPRQNKPYPPLVEVVKNQSIFEFHNVEGTIVGFRCPIYAEGINVPGYHLHFITEDRKAGGHLLECQVQNIGIEIDYTSEFYMVLPENAEFYAVNLEEEKHQELEKVEK